LHLEVDDGALHLRDTMTPQERYIPFRVMSSSHLEVDDGALHLRGRTLQRAHLAEETRRRRRHRRGVRTRDSSSHSRARGVTRGGTRRDIEAVLTDFTARA
jgi:hypothetical protein